MAGVDQRHLPVCGRRSPLAHLEVRQLAEHGTNRIGPFRLERGGGGGLVAGSERGLDLLDEGADPADPGTVDLGATIVAVGPQALLIDGIVAKVLVPLRVTVCGEADEPRLLRRAAPA